MEQAENKIIKGAEDPCAKVEKPEESLLKNKWVKAGAVIAGVLIIAGTIIYLQISKSRISIDKSLISSPLIDLSPSVSGQLNQTYVNEGDVVSADTAVAEVGNEIIKTKIAGVIVKVQKDIGKTFNPGQMVVEMVDPTQLRVVGNIDENKGLSDIHVGQLAEFTVDTFGSKKYSGVVDEVGSTSNQSDVVFNISDQRATQQFSVKVRFNPDQYPELKNGMSAKLTIFIK